MKTIFILLTAFFSAWALQAQTFNSAVDYYNYFTAEQNEITQTNMEYLSKSVHSDNDKKIEQKRQEVIKQIQAAIDKTKKLTPYPGGEKLKEDALKVFLYYWDVFTLDFKTANDLMAGSQDSYEAMEKYQAAVERAEKRLDEASDQFEAACDAFAQANNINVIKKETDNSRVIKKVGELNRHKRAIYLSYFRVSKENGRLMEAINAKKGEEVEARRGLLLEACTATLAELREIKPFYNDDSYRQAAIKLVNYLQTLGQKDFADVARILQLGDQKTQKDVDRFNQVIQQYNLNANKYIAEFNNAQEKISQKYVPKSYKK